MRHVVSVLRAAPIAMATLVGAQAYLSGCMADGVAPTERGLELRVAPVSYEDIIDACYTVTVTNEAGGGGQTVWRRTGICASSFGDGEGAITYIGTCDGDPAGRINSVILELDALFGSGTGAARAGDKVALSSPQHYVNPCPTGANRCVLEFPCEPNTDTLVEFNLTVLRNAQQGFFDIAVNFEDIFCSAKIDCTYDEEGTRPIELLHDADGVRSTTAVVALACTHGPSADVGTVLHVNGPRIECGSSGPTGVTASIGLTCNSSDEGFGLEAFVTGDGVGTVIPVLFGVDDGVPTSTALPLTANGTTFSNGAAWTRLGDDRVAGFVFDLDGGAFSLAIWARSPSGWILEQTLAFPGGQFDFEGDTITYDPIRHILWVRVETANGSDVYAVPLGSAFTLGAPVVLAAPAPLVHCRLDTLAGELATLRCRDADGDISAGRVWRVPSWDPTTSAWLGAFADITPPDLTLNQAWALCGGDRWVGLVGTHPATDLVQWTNASTPAQTTLESDVYVVGAVDELLITSPTNIYDVKTVRRCAADGGWQVAPPLDTGNNWLVPLPGGAGVAGTVDDPQPGGLRRPFVAAFPSDGNGWSLGLLPIPTECTTLDTYFNGLVLHGDGTFTATARCEDALAGDYHHFGARYGTDLSQVAWHRFDIPGAGGDFQGIMEQYGIGASALGFAQAPDCDAYVGGSRDGNYPVATGWPFAEQDDGALLPRVVFPPTGYFATGSGGAQSFTLDLDPTVEGNAYQPPRTDGPVFQYAGYMGSEQLECGEVSCQKVYWNLAIGFDASVPDCWLTWEATAAAAPGLVNGQTPKGTVYPWLFGQVQLTTGSKEGADASLACRMNPLNGKSSDLQTQYTAPGTPRSFCHRYDGVSATTFPECTWVPYSGESDAATPIEADPVDKETLPQAPDGSSR